MRHLVVAVLALAQSSLCFALPPVYKAAVEAPSQTLPIPGLPWSDPPPYNASVRPLVIWHGLGDSANSAGMLEFAELCRGVHPGMFVHNIYVEKDLEKDQRAGFFGNVWEQLEVVSAQLNNITELQWGFDAIGFSQGGQFLRAYVEKYNSPPVGNLITFGSQHMGVSDLPVCRPGDALCQLARFAARRGVYSSYAQSNLVQAQYFRDPRQLPRYYASNVFLTAINGEVAETRNATFKENLKSLEALVLVLFDQDKTVVPRESSWFGSIAPPTEEEERSSGWGDPVEVIPMRLQPLYTHDWIGLKSLDQKGRVTLLSCEGEHMQISEACWKPIVLKYTGGTHSVKEHSPQAHARPLVIQS